MDNKDKSSLHSVSLTVAGRSYTANIWRGSADEWRLLSVEVHGAGFIDNLKITQPSCRAVLEAAEGVAQNLLAEADVGPGAPIG